MSATAGATAGPTAQPTPAGPTAGRNDGPTLETVVDRLAGWAPTTDDLEAARLRVADVACAIWLGGTLAGWAPARRALRRLLSAPGGGRTSQGMGSSAGARGAGSAAGGAAEGAVLAACCRLTEIDDIELASCTTPGSVVVPAALAAFAVGPATGAGHGGLLAAVAAGYEVVAGAAGVLGGAFAPSAGIWPTRAVAAVAAAATVARALGLTPQVEREAVALAAGMSSVGVVPEPARSWSLGMAVAQGIGAAMAAAEGLRGDGRLLARWPAGVYGQPPPGAVERVGAALEAGPSAVRRSRLKPYAAARQVLAGSAMLRSLVEAGAVDPAAVAEVVLAVPAVHAAMVDRRSLAVRLDTLASAPYQLATALEAPGRLDELDHAVPPPPAIAARMATVEVVADPIELAGLAEPARPAGPAGADPLASVGGASFPARWGARLELVLADGRREVHHAAAVPYEEAFGWAEVEAKARRLASANGVDAHDVAHLVALVRKDDWEGLAAALAGDRDL